MKANNRIKIVKRAEREDDSKVEKNTAPEKKPAQNPTQNVARQVASWVKEFELRRRRPVTRNFASLFMKPELKQAS